MILKRKCCGPTLVPPWGFVYDIKKDVPPGPYYTLWCRRGDWYMILKMMCCLQTLPTLSGASVMKGLCILPSVWLFIGTCKQLSFGA